MSTEHTINKVPPNSLEIEQTVLGSCILEKEGCKIACELLNERVFYYNKNLLIFKAIKHLYISKMPVDVLTLSQELIRTKQLNEVGGAYEISQLTTNVASSYNIEAHCRILLQMFFKRELIRLSVLLNKESYDSFSDPFDLIDNLKKEIKKIESLIVTNEIIDNNKVIDTVVENIKMASENGGVTGFSTGIKSLDFGIMGLRPQLKYVIAALPGEGKSSLLQTIAVNLTHSQGLPGIIFSLEVPRELFMMGCISKILNIPNISIQNGTVSAHDIHQIKALRDTLFTKSLIIDDRGGIGPDQMWPTLRRLKESHDIKWFAVDYLGIEKLRGSEHKGKNEEQILNYITAEHKIMCKELDLVGFELVQFTKETRRREGARPTIGDLKGSAGIEANADVIVLIYRPEVHGLSEYKALTNTQGFAELMIVKNRFGPLKDLLTKYESEYTRFTNHESAGNEFVYEHKPF